MSEENKDTSLPQVIHPGWDTPEPTEESWKAAGERIRNQEPQFHEVYENSDFKQGMNRGAFLKENQIIQLFLDSDSACAEWAIGVIQGENK